MKIAAIPLILVFTLVACNSTPKVEDADFYFFGVATLKENSEICLQMLSIEFDMRVEDYECFKPNDPNYAKVREHIGPIEIGESKEFGPFGE